MVQHEFTRDNSGFLESIQVSNFKCDFNFLSDAEPNKPYLYQVYWYINGDIVYVTEAVKKEEFTKTFLNENNGKYKMGIQVSLDAFQMLFEIRNPCFFIFVII